MSECKLPYLASEEGNATRCDSDVYSYYRFSGAAIVYLISVHSMVLCLLLSIMIKFMKKHKRVIQVKLHIIDVRLSKSEASLSALLGYHLGCIAGSILDQMLLIMSFANGSLWIYGMDTSIGRWNAILISLRTDSVMSAHTAVLPVFAGALSMTRNSVEDVKFKNRVKANIGLNLVLCALKVGVSSQFEETKRFLMFFHAVLIVQSVFFIYLSKIAVSETLDNLVKHIGEMGPSAQSSNLESLLSKLRAYKSIIIGAVSVFIGSALIFCNPLVFQNIGVYFFYVFYIHIACVVASGAVIAFYVKQILPKKKLFRFKISTTVDISPGTKTDGSKSPPNMFFPLQQALEFFRNKK